jgi:hypothetical protein
MKRASPSTTTPRPAKRVRFTIKGEAIELASDESDDYAVTLSDAYPLVPDPEAPRHLNWSRILAAIPEDEREATKRFILENHLDYFIDGDHPVGYPWKASDTVLRFMPQTKWIRAAKDAGILDLNKIAALPMDVLERRQFDRDLGYSLQRYGEIDQDGHRGWFRRHMCTRAPALLCETCRPHWFLQEGTCPCGE